MRKTHCKNTAVLLGALMLCAVAMDASAASATAETAIAVDVRADACRAVGQADIGYSPSWSGVTNAGAYVVLSKVVGGATNIVATLPADEESSYAYTPGEGDPSCLRFVHQAYSSGGVEMGNPLVCDVSFGFRSAEGGAFCADSRANSLQLVVKERKPVPLAYSTSWATNAAAVTISAVKLSGQGGADVETNTIFSASADAEGVTNMGALDIGWWRLVFRSRDSEDGTLLEYLTDEFRMPGGFVLSFR